jgi:hypothetical protein
MNMSETYRSNEPSGSNSSYGSNNNAEDPASNEVGRTLLVGVLGGLLSAAGYVVYQRLPDDQKQRLQAQAKGLFDSKLNELRQSFNF